MREILFRGRRVDNREWVYGFLCCANIIDEWTPHKCKDEEGNTYEYCTTESYKVIPETVGQFTGVIDKNGKKVFEGDVVKYNGSCGKIVFSEYHGAFMSKEKDIYLEWLSKIPRYGTGIMEIIGNIYDNKEILEDKE